MLDESISNDGMFSSQVFDEIPKSDASSLVLCTDYSSLFGEEFSLSENHFDGSFLNILDIAAVEEGILHVLYAAASQVIFLMLSHPYIFQFLCMYHSFYSKGIGLFDPSQLLRLSRNEPPRPQLQNWVTYPPQLSIPSNLIPTPPPPKKTTPVLLMLRLRQGTHLFLLLSRHNASLTATLASQATEARPSR